MLDEPSSSLDFEARERLIEIIRGFDHTILPATHDMDMARELCPRALLIEHGRITADAPTSEVIARIQ